MDNLICRKPLLSLSLSLKETTSVIASLKKSVGVVASSGQNSWVFDTLYVCFSEGQMLMGVIATSPKRQPVNRHPCVSAAHAILPPLVAPLWITLVLFYQKTMNVLLIVFLACVAFGAALVHADEEGDRKGAKR